MKKILSIVLAVILLIISLLNLAACSDNGNEKQESSDTSDFINNTNTESSGTLATSDSSEETSEYDVTQSSDELMSSEYEFVLLDDNTYAIKNFIDTSLEHIEIPSTHNGKAVTSILSDAFLNGKYLKSIVVPTSITEIKAGAFRGCSNVESMTLPFIGNIKNNDTNQYPLGYIFGKAAFPGAVCINQLYNFKEIYGELYSTANDDFYIPSSLRSITVLSGDVYGGAFFDCAMLQTCIFEDGVTLIKGNAFSIYCDGLETVVIGDGVKEIEDYSFSSLWNLKNVTLGKNLRRIGFEAFLDCRSLESIVIPSSVKEIGVYAFRKCTALKSVIFENTVGWYRPGYTSPQSTRLDVTDPEQNAILITDTYDDDKWGVM